MPAWRSAKVLSSAAAVAVMALVGVATYTYRAPLRATASLIVARALAPAPQAEAAPVSLQSSTQAVTHSAAGTELATTPAPVVAAPDAMVAIDGATTAPVFDPGTMIASAPDSIRWIPAVARTWVNVRNDASRDGNVVGVINPASRAMLGTTRAGWRQVKSTEVTGWVDPRLFEPDSLRTRG